MSSPHDVVVTGVGVLSAAGLGLQAHLEALAGGRRCVDATAYSLLDFNPAPFVGDRRVLKAIKHTDALGLVATEQLRQSAGPSLAAYASARRGLYFGAMPPAPSDHDAYLDAMAAARIEEGRVSVRAFGRTSQSAKPTTLLAGLANNVLCYAALQFDARGANSNYVSGPISGSLALLQAARRLSWGKIDCAVAGAYAAQTEPVHAAVFASLGHVRAQAPGEQHAISPYGFLRETAAGRANGTVLADGAVAVLMERRDGAMARGAKILATLAGGAAGQDGMGPLRLDVDGVGLAATMRTALADTRISPDEVGLLLLNGSGIDAMDRGEWAAVLSLFPNAATRPALAATSPVLGNMMEAAGVLETAIASWLYQRGEVPAPMRPLPEVVGGPASIPSHRRYALVVRMGHHGDHCGLVLRMDPP